MNRIVTEFFIRGRNINTPIVFITQSEFKVPKDVRLSSAHFLIMKNSKRKRTSQVALTHSSDINFKDYKKGIVERYSFLVNNATLPSDNPLRFRKNLLE